MGVSFCLVVEYTRLIQAIYTHLSMSMYDVMILHDDPHMYDLTFLVIKECKIPGFAFIDKAQRFALGRLLRGVPKQGMAVDLVYHLGESTAIQSKRCLSSPKIGAVQE